MWRQRSGTPLPICICCQKAIGPNRQFETPCGHRFHDHCAIKWRKTNQTCCLSCQSPILSSHRPRHYTVIWDIDSIPILPRDQPLHIFANIRKQIAALYPDIQEKAFWLFSCKDDPPRSDCLAILNEGVQFKTMTRGKRTPDHYIKWFLRDLLVDSEHLAVVISDSARLDNAIHHASFLIPVIAVCDRLRQPPLATMTADWLVFKKSKE